MFSSKAIVSFALVALFLGTAVEGKVYGRCELVQTLRNYGIAESQLGTWTCIAQHESDYNTEAINSSTGDYGIFQISHLYWCSDSSTPGKECGITCSSLLVDDITGSIKCSLKVFQETEALGKNGFSAWTTYQYCTGDQSSYTAGC